MRIPKMFVIKRDESKQQVSFDKIYDRIQYLSSFMAPLKHINAHMVAQRVIRGLHDGVRTSEIDNQTAIICDSLSIQHYEYGVLAGRIAINNHHKNTLTSFKDKVDRLYFYRSEDGTSVPYVSTAFYKFIKRNQRQLEKYIDYNRDYLIDYFGFKTLFRAYLLRIPNGDSDTIIERPQDLFMRVAVAIHLQGKKTTMQDVYETYDLLSQKYLTHATPTLYNAGSPDGQLASCFLLNSEDSIAGIYKTLTDCAHISKWSGGIGVSVSDWRGKGSLIRGTKGRSNGIVPFLQVYEKTALAVNQGGKRPGSISPYLEPHHPDIMAFLDLSRKNAAEEFRANKLFLAVWVSDLFMERVRDDKSWSLLDPRECPRLTETYGDEFRELYIKYEKEGRAKSTIRARSVWKRMFESQKEAGVPYILYKDRVNECSNQKNLGTIKSSNLCSEIVEYSSPTEYAVCTLCSLCLPRFVEDTWTAAEMEASPRRELNHEFPVNPSFNYEKFRRVVRASVCNLNRVIDINYYPLPETKRSNLRHRPIGIGVQGLATLFLKMNLLFDSTEARDLNRSIFEVMYYTALQASNNQAREIYDFHVNECQSKGSTNVLTNPVVAQKDSKVSYTKTTYTDQNKIPSTCGSYSSFDGSPLSQGQFHWEMYGADPATLMISIDEWNNLRENIRIYGTRNSLLIALMPTASTSQIMGNSEGFEPLTSNVFIRTTLAGEFVVMNKYLTHDLMQLGLWNDTIKNEIELNAGSIQSISSIPESIRRKYRTVWELSQKTVIDLAADRQAFVDQSQSMNLHINNLEYRTFNSMHFYGWKKGLKTGCYYLRSTEAVMPQKFTATASGTSSNTSSNTSPGASLAPSMKCKVIGKNDDCAMCSA